MNKFIEIRCDKYAEFDINLAADSSNTQVIFQNGYFNLPMTIQTALGYSPSYVSVALDTILRIYGDVTQIEFIGQDYFSYRFITDSNTSLNQMFLQRLGLKNIDLKNLTALRYLHLYACSLYKVPI
jgi:hypothetical protein